MKEQENTKVVQDIYSAFQRGDIQSILDTLADDVQWWVAGSPDTLPYAGLFDGREEVAKFFASLGSTLEFERFEPQEYIAQGEKVIALGQDRRRVRSNNRVLENQWAMAFTVQQGKITRF